MKNILKFLALSAAAVLSASCYEDFLSDYDYSSVYFASQKPLRTVIAGRNNTIQVGVAIAGKREVDPKDWATFEISMMDMVGSGLTLMPDDYYTLSDPEKMTVGKANLPIASVNVTFTDAFFEDPLATTKFYGIPFRILESSLDSISVDKAATVVAVKYASQYSGTYCVSGTVSKVGSSDAPVSYGSLELNSTYTRNTSTESPDKVVLAGLGNTFPAAAGENVSLTFGEGGALTVAGVAGGVAVSDATGTWEDGERLKINLSYKYVKGGQTYQVEETLLRRQDPESALRFEEW